MDAEQKPREVDINFLVGKAISEATTAAMAEATRLAKEAITAAQQPPKIPEIPKFEAQSPITQLVVNQIDGYLENRIETPKSDSPRGNVNPLQLFSDVDDPFGGPNKAVFPPLYPQLRKSETLEDYVVIRYGSVIELNRTKGETENALIVHSIGNLGDNHYVLDGQAVYVYFKESATGEIDFSTIAIVVDADNLESRNYNANIGFGEYYYKLAVFGLSIDGVPSLTMVCAGSHIYHETGQTADYRVMSCSDPVDPELNPQVQHSRLRFVSGRLAGIDEDVNDVPLCPYVTEFNVETCT